MSSLLTTGLQGLPSLVPNDDLALLLVDAVLAQGLQFQTGDVMVVAQKAVSKVEDRYVDLSTITPSDEAKQLAIKVHKDPRLVDLILQESQEIVRAVPGVLIVRHCSGHVMANAGIDASNLPSNNDDCVLLLPQDSDQSAAQLANQISSKVGVNVAVVISDSFGRPWRQGVTNVALGVAGVSALFDKRNEQDLFGRTLQVTQVGVGDLLACAAGLVMGEGSEGVPAAHIRGLSKTYLKASEHNSACALLRPAQEDLFR